MNGAKDAIRQDRYRYFGDRKPTLKEWLFRPIEQRYMEVFRKIQFASNPLSEKWNKLRLIKMSAQSMIQIPAEVQIGKGFYIGHSGRIIINKNVKIGSNVNIATGVTIGETNRGAGKGVPQIGDYVWIGTNAVIVGRIKIGNDVMIAPNSFVNFDVPDHCVVLGNPGQIHNKDKATQDYINRTV